MRLNPHLFPVRATVKNLLTKLGKVIVQGESPRGFTLRLTGQVRGGKNAMGITRTGRHYARTPFKIWRDAAVSGIQRQLPTGWIPIAGPVSVRLDYVAGDQRRRDMPAILDAIWHVLEKAGVVTDDTLLWVTQSARSHDPKNAGATITFL